MIELKDIKSHHDDLIKRHYSALELAQFYLDRIQQHKPLNAVISVDEEGALMAAKIADKHIRKGQAGPLTGLPMLHKDNFCTTRLRTTCGSKMLAEFQSPYDATVVAKLAKAGAVMLGKTNMDEFAMGSSNESSYFGAVHNPWDLERVPGGSSGGSAAAIGASLAVYATGTDTGGSIRQPAAFCGISGLKPTYGLLSRYGMVAYASSLDQAGPMAHSALDLAYILTAMAGFDDKDSTSLSTPHKDYTQGINKPLEPFKFGVPTCFLSDDLPDAIQQSLKLSIETLEQLGGKMVPIELKTVHLWVPCYYVIACAEASSNLSRFDGIRFGYRTAQSRNVDELMRKSRSEGFGLEVQRRILTGTHLLSAGFFDAYYLQALKVRRIITDECKKALESVDFLLGPTTPTSAFKMFEPIENPTLRYLADIYTVIANLTGFPALSIPAGFDDKLPLGIQLIGPYLQEQKLLKIAHHFQLNSDWHHKRPF